MIILQFTIYNLRFTIYDLQFTTHIRPNSANVCIVVTPSGFISHILFVKQGFTPLPVMWSPHWGLGYAHHVWIYVIYYLTIYDLQFVGIRTSPNQLTTSN